jgi:hypothetical protein
MKTFLEWVKIANNVFNDTYEYNKIYKKDKYMFFEIICKNHAINNQLRKNVKKIAYINNDNIIKIFNSCMDASKELNVNCRSINKCCKGELKTCGEKKLTFKYLEDYNKNDNIIKNVNINVKNKKPKKINIYDKNNILLETCNTITETSKKYKVNNKTIVAHCDNKVKYSNLDYYFRYNLL